MSIDWITVAAQIANFLVLVWLLKRFLYRPILDGIDAREAEITRRMAEAGETENRAEIAELDFKDRSAELLSGQSAAVEKALDASKEAREALLASARQAVELEQQNSRVQMEREREMFTSRLARSGADTVVELTRRALHDLADEKLEVQIARHVVERLKPMSAELIEAAGHETKAVATTRAPLPVGARDQLFTEVRSLMPGTELRFDIDPEQSYGLILRIGGARVDWTVESYTDGFAALLNERLSAGSSVLSAAIPGGTA